jgi:hypothetical protein
VEKSFRRHTLNERWQALKSERSSWIAQWREISKFMLPWAGRFLASDRNKGWKRHNLIRDNTGIRALRTLAAGMMAGATSPARPWFRLQTPDEELNSFHAVALWLSQTTRLMQRIFQKSNAYRALHVIYEELGAFGTAACPIFPDFENVTHHYPLTIGEYCLATDYQGRVRTLYREFQKTVSETVAEFGYDKVTPRTKNLYDRGALDTWLTIIHVIEPRTDRDPKLRDKLNMAWRSVYFEEGSDPDKYLSESGFPEFPCVCPRWTVSGGDIYGSSPGMDALGDVKQLQHGQYRKLQALDLASNPPALVTGQLKGREVDLSPGGVNYSDNPNAGISSALKIGFDPTLWLQDIADVRERINGACFVDLFLMIANSNDGKMTATEVAIRQEEKMLMLGPVLERLHNELLSPLIEITFARMVETGIIPPVPQELQGMELDVEFVSMLAQAQKAIGVNAIDRFTSSLGALASIKGEVLDRVDADKWVEIYADSLGVDPRILVAGETAALIRQERAEAQQAAQQSAAMNQGADTLQKLGGVDMDKTTAASKLIDPASR